MIWFYYFTLKMTTMSPMRRSANFNTLSELSRGRIIWLRDAVILFWETGNRIGRKAIGMTGHQSKSNNVVGTGVARRTTYHENAS